MHRTTIPAVFILKTYRLHLKHSQSRNLCLLKVFMCIFQHGYILLAELCSSQNIHLKMIYYSLYCCWKSLFSLKFASQGIAIDCFTQHVVTKRFTVFSQSYEYRHRYCAVLLPRPDAFEDELGPPYEDLWWATRLEV